MTIYLGPPLLAASSSLPIPQFLGIAGNSGGNPLSLAGLAFALMLRAYGTYLALLPVGFS